MVLGYKLRTGGGLEPKVFGVFGFQHEGDEETEDAAGNRVEPAQVKEAQAWAKKQNKAARELEKPFVFSAHIPDTPEEAADLYAKFLAMSKTRGAFMLYK